jgi:hypothetical protein
MPYRTLDDRIDGVVITFADITVAKKLETQLREQHAVLEKHFAEQSGAMEKAGNPARTKIAGPKRSVAGAKKLPVSNEI